MTQDISNWTLTGLLQRQAEAQGEREFMSFEHGTSLSFASLHADSNRLARNLASLGVTPGDRVMVMPKNRIEFMLAMFAIMKLGAIFVPVNTELKGAFLSHQMRNAEPCMVFLDHDLRDAFDAVQGGNDNLASVIYVAGHVPKERPAVFADAEAMTFENLFALAGTTDDVIVTAEPQDIACIMYTSGTTGPSKGVLMPHAHCYLFGHGMARTMAMTEKDCQYVCMPLFHAMGLLLQVVSSLITGSKVFCIERFSPARWLDDVRESGATVTNALGVIPEFIFRTPESEYDRDHKLRVVVAVPIAAEWGEAMEKRFGFKFMQAYGMTEVNIPCYTSEADPLLPGMAGHVIDDFFEVRVVDAETDAVMAQGEIGEIVVRPKVPFCFNQGYFRMEERTVEAWRNLWFHSGDAGYFDEQGRLFYADRIRDRIRRRGENISSFEIEQVLNDHPDVQESAVVGIRVEGAGGEDEVKAYIVTARGEDIDNVALLDYCAVNIPRFAVPRYVEAVEEVPKTATGKIQKEPLRQAGVTNRTWDRESVGYKIARRV
ncbi:MAG: AMP-binding protein [Alphaproteobacteria bacterium]|nr:AMP-binding protein [Alphaproteobacteria bacterium]MDP6871907.1 AMP-binding protein [Alphaproteobacteria bacterium]